MTDPYVDPATGVLRNRLGIVDPAELAQVEAQLVAIAEFTLYRTAEPGQRHDLAQLRSIHRHLFGEVYDWAGELRTVDIAKGETLFARAIHLQTQADAIFAELAGENFLRGLARPVFVRKAARLLGDLNALHPFREGNGRAQRAFLQLLSRDAGWQLAWAKVDPEVNNSRSAAAMADVDALAPMLEEIVTAVGEALPSDALLLPPTSELSGEAPSTTEYLGGRGLAGRAFPRPLPHERGALPGADRGPMLPGQWETRERHR